VIVHSLQNDYTPVKLNEMDAFIVAVDHKNELEEQEGGVTFFFHAVGGANMTFGLSRFADAVKAGRKAVAVEEYAEAVTPIASMQDISLDEA
jgi:hypothetical protein